LHIALCDGHTQLLLCLFQFDVRGGGNGGSGGRSGRNGRNGRNGRLQDFPRQDFGVLERLPKVLVRGVLVEDAGQILGDSGGEEAAEGLGERGDRIHGVSGVGGDRGGVGSRGRGGVGNLRIGWDLYHAT
jgi:hypothetical protein